MKESTQTLLFIAVALFSVLIATQSQPTDATYEVSEEIGKPLFAPFEPEQAKSLRIVRFNEETATLRDFEVAEEDGVWSIPSKGGYPADAERQMAEASTGVTDLEILSIASQSAEDHAAFGVVEPSSELEVGATGVGTRVTLADVAGESLVDVVVGKAVRDADDQRFVRRTSQDIVFTAAIDPSKFSTKFEDWIEDDLLDLDAWDIARVQVKDYTAELVMQGFRPAMAFDPRADLTIDYNEDDSAWQARVLRQYNKEAEAYEDFELTDLQELNKEILDDLKSAVGDLKIADVERKPGGLSADLKAGDDFFGNRSAVSSLMKRGFAPTRGEGDSTEILSSEGEVLVTTKEGIEYVLRFGKLQLAEDDEPSADDSEEGEATASGVNRYLFVMARLNKDLIDAPELEIVPEEDAEAETESEEGGDAEEPADSREEVEKRNQRQQDEYDEKVAAAEKRVGELNDRFGDWYYVIADEVYKKIALGRDELIVAKEPEEGDEAKSTAPVPTGPLGSVGGGIPGLPDVPGVDFNPTPDPGTNEATESEADAPAAEEATTGELPEESPADPAEEAAADAVEAAIESE